MKRIILSLILVAGVTLPVSASAQSSLQNTNNNIQSQTGQAQNSANTQNQVGTLQNNNTASQLNQAGGQPLGVVSNPNQTSPEAVAQPSSDLKTDITKDGGMNWWLVVIAVTILIFIVLCWLAIREPYAPNKPAAKQVKEPAPAKEVRPEPVKTPKKKKTIAKSNRQGRKKKSTKKR